MPAIAKYLMLALPVTALLACQQPVEPPAPPAPEATAPDAGASLGEAPLPTPSGSASAAGVDSPLASVDWGNLAAHIGKYPTEIDLFGHGPIGEELERMLDGKMPVLEANLKVAGPLQKEGDVYYLLGNAPHQGGHDQAYLLLDPSRKAIEVGLWQRGELSTWTTPDASIPKPADVQTMLANAQEQTPAGEASGPPAVMPAK